LQVLSAQRDSPAGQTMPLGQSSEVRTQDWSEHKKGLAAGHVLRALHSAGLATHLPSGQSMGLRGSGQVMVAGQRDLSGTHSPVGQVKPGQATEVAGQLVNEVAHWPVPGHCMALAGHTLT
jgi:hypothetical protein